MLAEFAITPAIFDDEAHSDKDVWLEQLRELGATMFPRLSASPIMLTNLYEGSWYPEVEKIVAAIKDHRARKLCQELLIRCGESLVFRPACDEWPQSEIAWGREAILSARDEPIERIIASQSTCDSLNSEGHSIRCISEIGGAGFWNGIGADGTVPMRLADQGKLVRKLCLHSEFLCVLTPHIYGGTDDETDFAIELIRSAQRRPSGYHPVEIDVHTEGPSGKANDPDFASRMTKVVSNIMAALQPTISSGSVVRLFVWPKLLHRYVVGGTFAERSGGVRSRSPRWGIALTHFARRRDQPELAPSPWNLLTKASLVDCFNRYFSDDATGYLTPSPITIKR